LIFIDYQDSRPIYEQIVERFEKLILTGAVMPDSRLPSVRQLASDLSINPNTIQKAYTILEKEGYIYPVKGKGNFVNGNLSLKQKKKEDCFQRLSELLYECKEFGVTAAEALNLVEQVYRKAQI
jgi:GntR family transcriptional regulator